ncbi:Aminotransferase class IV [Parasponia andersonii]|uniref:Aminotransferase class IV n=1 Tax=Parasponia andersonii TaxID=3476 RepID=A0A2P5C251_PARAD|nr:Aminotransferase class IV [Parasponia andersonii]
MGASLKKDLRVSRVRPEESLNAFFFLFIGVLSQKLVVVRKTARSLVQVQNGPVVPRKRIEEAFDSFMHAPLGLGRLRVCNDRVGEQYPNLDWDVLGFGVVSTDDTYIMKCSIEETFLLGKLVPYGNIELNPSVDCRSLELWTGLKAYRRRDGRTQLFRPEQNALRMKMGAERLCMPSPSVEQFIDAVPPPGKALYLRSLPMGNGPILGLAPAPEFTFLVFSTPVGNYHEGRPALNLFVDNKIHKAIPGRTGGVKSITNHSPNQAKAKGYSDVFFLDCINGKYVEEVSASIHGTILPGITRMSSIDIAHSFGYQVKERLIRVEDLLEADEVFCTGTAVVVNPVGNVTYQDKRVEYKTGKEALSDKLYETLTRIQTGCIEGKMGWTLEVNVQDIFTTTPYFEPDKII